MAEFGTAKTVFILAIVVGCFAILWPKIFYPMLLSSLSGGGAPAAHQQESPLSNEAKRKGNNCCDVIFETDVTAIKVLSAMCGDILHKNQLISGEHVHLPKASVIKCRDEVLSACGLDITAVIKDHTGLTKSYKQILDEIRSYNNSACLKETFGVQLSMIGTPRRMRYFPERYFRDKTTTARHLRPERPTHLHPEMLHPALREKGRAIPARPITVASATGMDGTASAPRPGYPMPGMRPPLGGGHVVPGPKGSGTMGIVMPMYTVGIVIFFVYTIMKVLFKKQDDRNKSADFGMDPEIRRMMFGAAAMEECAVNHPHAAAPVPAAAPAPVATPAPAAPIPVPAPTPKPAKQPSPEPIPAPAPEQVANGSATPANGVRAASPPKSSKKLGDAEIDQLRRRLEETEAAMERIVAQIETAVEPSRPSSSLLKTVPRQGDEEEEQGEFVEEIIVDEKPIEKEIAEVIEKENIEATKEEIPVAPVEEPIVEAAQVKPVEVEAPAEEEEEEEILDNEPLIEEPLEEEIANVTGDEPEEEPKESLVPTNGHLPERCTTPLQQLLEEGGGKVTVLNMETTARYEDGQKMVRPQTPSTPPRSITPIMPLYGLEQFTPTPAYRWSRPATPTSMTPPRSSTPLQRPFSATPPPTHGYLAEGHLPGGHGILVADSECEATPVGDFDYDDLDLDEEAPPVILSGKMTLSVINLPEAIAAEAAAAAAAAAVRNLDKNKGGLLVSKQKAEQHQASAHAAPLVEATKETNVLKENGVKQQFDVNGADEISATQYTTASAAAAEDGAGLEETSADVSGMDDQAEALDIDEPPADIEDLPRDDASSHHNQSNGLQ